MLLPGTPTGDPAPPPTAVAALADLAAHGIDPDAPADTDGKCTDEAATWLATGWPGTVHWGLGTAGIPAYLGSTDAVRDVVRRAAGNVDVGHNACGLPENLGASAQFDGDTTRRAAVHPDGSCGPKNVTVTIPSGHRLMRYSWCGRGSVSSNDSIRASFASSAASRSSAAVERFFAIGSPCCDMGREAPRLIILRWADG